MAREWTRPKVSLPEPGKDVTRAKNLAGQREEVARVRVMVRDGREEYGPDKGLHRLRTVVDLRAWMGRSSAASVVYASAWLVGPEPDERTHGRYLSGYGEAGGGGYCKTSAAFESALRSCGVTTEPGFGGAGSQPTVAAAVAVAVALGWRRSTLHVVSDF